MPNQRTMLYFFAYITLAMAAMMTVKADDRPQTQNAVPDGAAERISDWALAGVIWSDASLTKKLASEAAKHSESNEQKQQLQAIAKQSTEIVDALEEFGWKQTKRSPASTTGNRSEKTTARKPALDSSIKRYDTETPAGHDDPGLDDERTGDNLRLDVDQYRVDDYIDETPAEARNRADAIEDGVEGAIAAAAGRRGTGRPTAGHISEREVQTRSATLPYAEDSIYDSDDYDPTVDYDVNNPLGVSSTNPASADLGDRDDDINLGDPAKEIDGEDELIAAMARENESTATRAHSSKSSVEMDRYTNQRSSNHKDANWVQFQLNANQATWSKFTTDDNVVDRTRMAITKLKSDATAALAATSNPQLAKILQAIIE
ncbi:MAG: hypothetical protein WBD31_20675 [Rubripirellula sp.]